MPGGKRVNCYTCCGTKKVRVNGQWVSCNTCGGSGQVNTR